ncbi:sulfate permease NDAI_0B02020 [Naumovozyma dairenensis CBS 421]|uniref:STAS domain-containing protein n=1 Tax=Naumovozyma dairenensis (strain ATCC 10597 / BCRC 20456 / CBS 421 / NBRC 0211 / NRRL Y-12639) TaxID=1071378 RepID=G0W626_NAUDC|nr:hypothetical protein NDAI_0B02020 [Naumovozyma dairenensis CBS 421]CCD23237.1 hypothetical protein NDAI_0B02020 [Naumovozyma dairenensis CBS 421]
MNQTIPFQKNENNTNDIENQYELPSFPNSDTSSQNLADLELEYDQYKASETNNKSNHGPDLETNNLDVQFSNTYNTGDKKNSIKNHQIQINTFNADSVIIPSFEEHAISFKDYYRHSLKENFSLKSVKEYALSIFPIIRWLPHYNLAWFSSDLIAGITVGCVLVPQSMSYAQIATLPPQYGLYSSFIGAFTYSLFATSKDVCIGPVAVMSLETGKVITKVLAKYPEADPNITAPVIATVLAFLCGVITAGIGFLRLGFLVELISLNAVTGFMTGSALNIMWGQIPALMGYGSKVNTRTSTYKVIIESLKHLPDTKLDAVFGLIPLFILYLWKWWCGNMGPRMADKWFANNEKGNFYLKKFYFYAQAAKNAVIIIVFTAIAWSITKGKTKDERPISILGSVPKGLKEVGVMKLPDGLASKIAPELPASVIVLLLEHIAIAKSFGRINDYKVVPDQELIAIGVTNLIGTFFNAYPATGSFSRSALKAKCEVRTPLSGLFTGSCVLLALYCLTGVFLYIPKATLSAVIIHAVSDLIASYHTTWNFWKMNPLDCFSFIVTVFITVFSSIENGIYFAMCWSCAILVLKVAFPAGKFLGRVEIAEVVNGCVDDSFEVTDYSSNSNLSLSADTINHNKKLKILHIPLLKTLKDQLFSDISSIQGKSKIRYYTKWLPFDHAYTKELNPNVIILPPPPGVIVYRLTDSFTYMNCSKHYDVIFEEIKKQTKRGQLIRHRKKSDRPWNDPGEWEAPNFSKLWKKLSFRRNKNNNDNEETHIPDVPVSKRDDRPLLKVLCLDFSQVAQVDATALQSLVDLRKAINKYADRQVEFHFAGIVSPWIKKGLINIGFGTINEEYSDESIIAGHTSYHLARIPGDDLELPTMRGGNYKVYTATGTNLPFFHIDIPDFYQWDV